MSAEPPMPGPEVNGGPHRQPAWLLLIDVEPEREMDDDLMAVLSPWDCVRRWVRSWAVSIGGFICAFALLGAVAGAGAAFSVRNLVQLVLGWLLASGVLGAGFGLLWWLLEERPLARETARGSDP